MVVFMLLVSRVHVFANVMCLIWTEKHGSERVKVSSNYCSILGHYIGRKILTVQTILHWIPSLISAVLYLKRIEDESKRKVHARTTKCMSFTKSLHSDKLQEPSTVPICTRLISYWAGYQLLAPHNYINKFVYPNLLPASVFQFDKNSNKSIGTHLTRRTQKQQLLPFSRSFLPSTRWIPSL